MSRSWAMICPRPNTLPGLVASNLSMSNSVGVRRTMSTPDAYLTTQNVHHEAREHQFLLHGLGVQATAAEVGPHPACQLPSAEGFDHVIVCADFETDDDARLVVTGREHNYWDTVAGTQFLAEGDPVDTREHQVQDNQVERVGGAEETQRGLAAVRYLHVHPLGFEGDFDHVSDARIVLYHEHPRHRPPRFVTRSLPSSPNLC